MLHKNKNAQVQTAVLQVTGAIPLKLIATSLLFH